VIKGAHLAHTIYPSPYLRPRRDTDLVITQNEESTMAGLLEAAGYRRLDHVRGRLVLGQGRLPLAYARRAIRGARKWISAEV
jgi:hypothetical protein